MQVGRLFINPRVFDVHRKLRADIVRAKKRENEFLSSPSVSLNGAIAIKPKSIIFRNFASLGLAWRTGLP